MVGVVPCKMAVVLALRVGARTTEDEFFPVAHLRWGGWKQKRAVVEDDQVDYTRVRRMVSSFFLGLPQEVVGRETPYEKIWEAVQGFS